MDNPSLALEIEGETWILSVDRAWLWAQIEIL